MKAGLLALTFAALGAQAVMDLTDDTFADTLANSGKNMFVKFFAPWCGHCKRMKPDWDKLGEAYADSSSVIVADVDCTVHKTTCSKYGVNGYPTVKYFTAETGESGADYKQARSYEALEKFVKDELEAKCVVEDPAGCTDKEKTFIEKVQAKNDPEFVSAQIKRLDGMKAKKMKPSLKTWVSQRLSILKQMVPKVPVSDEL